MYCIRVSVCVSVCVSYHMVNCIVFSFCVVIMSPVAACVCCFSKYNRKQLTHVAIFWLWHFLRLSLSRSLSLFLPCFECPTDSTE